MTVDFASLRREFPLLAQKTYLNSGSYCALARTVKRAFEAYMEDRLAVGANWDVWVMKNEAVRDRIARLLRAAPDEIAVTASVTAGINALATALDFTRDRNKVVVSDFEFPTSAQVWHAQAPRGADVVHVHCDVDGYIPLEHFAAQIDERTKLVAITHVCFRNGARLDIAGIIELAHRHGAKVLLDTYQSAGTIDIDVKELDVDFVSGGMFKYLLGTAGIGFLYVRGDMIEQLVPTHSGWFGQEDIQAMDITANRPSHSARRFEGGTPPVVNCYAAEAGLDVLLGVGTVVIESRIRDLTSICMRRLDEIGWPAVTPSRPERRGAMIAIPSSDSAGLSARLASRDIVTSSRDANLRASFHYYNDESDIDAFIAAMDELRDEYASSAG